MDYKIETTAAELALIIESLMSELDQARSADEIKAIADTNAEFFRLARQTPEWRKLVRSQAVVQFASCREYGIEAALHTGILIGMRIKHPELVK